MTKKFISLVLSLALVVCLLPVMGVQAAPTSFKVDNFQAYDLGVYSSADQTTTTLLKVNDATKWTVNKTAVVEIEDVEGYDGKTTRVLKYINNAGRSTNIDAGSYRLVSSPDTSETYTSLGDKLWVQELRLWLPADEDTDAGVNKIRPYKVNLGNILRIHGDNLYIADTLTSYTVDSCKWIKIKAVVDYSKYTAESKFADVILYVDDQFVYRAEQITYRPSKFATFSYFGIAASANSSKATDAVGGFNDVYFIIDDLNIYHTPSKTTPTSTFDGKQNVKKSSDIKVDFDNMILNAEIAGEATVTSDCVVMSDATDNAVAIESVTVSSDNKSLIINPKDDLAEGANYSVTVSGLTDMYGQSIENYSFNFTTSEPSSVTVSQPVFTKENLFVAGGASQTLTELENGYIKAAATVNNSANAPKEVMVLSMLKEGNDIKYFQFKNITVPAKGSAAFTAGFQVDNASSQKIETVVWDSIYNKTPLADKYEFSSSGYVKTDLDTLLGE